MRLGHELKRLGRHSAIYGLGGLVSRILATLLLPLYTHFLSPRAYGRVEIVTAATAVLAIALQLGISSAFFRFYFDARTDPERLTVIRTSFWFTMGMATLGLVVGFVLATPISHVLRFGDDPWLVRAGFVGLWAQMNYQQLTALFRVEERPGAFVAATIANVFITVGSTILLVVTFHKGATGAVVGNFIGTLAVYFVLLGYRRYQLGFQFDRKLLRAMNKFGMPLVPAALALWAINFIDRFFVAIFKGQAEVGVYSLAVRVASVIVFLMAAFQLAWPAFAYSIEEEHIAKRTYAFVLTYLMLLCSWASLVLGLLSPWIVRILAPRNEAFWRASEAVGILCFSATAYAGYTVLAIGIGRARRTQFNWIVTGGAALLNVALNFALIPPYGMMGAAIATLAAYVAMFVGMSLNAQRVWPVPYQWRRVLTLSLVAAALLAIGKAVSAPLPLAIALCLVYPVVLLPFRFYLPAELRRLRVRRMAA